MQTIHLAVNYNFSKRIITLPSICKSRWETVGDFLFFPLAVQSAQLKRCLEGGAEIAYLQL